MTTSQNPPTSLRKLRILLAEDNLVNRVLAQKLLQRNGHTVSLAVNGKDVVALWEASQPNSFDIILMDIQMPVMDGLQATSYIRATEAVLQAGSCAKDKPAIHIPIVAMTAHAMKGDRERYLAGGMDGYISKPINSADLERSMQSVVSTFTASTPDKNQLAAAEPAPLPALLPIEASDILAAFDNDLELVRELAELFISESPKYVLQMRDALRDYDAKALFNSAHALKGSVGNFSTKGPHATALRIEILAKAGELAGVLEILEALEGQLAQLHEILLGMAKQTALR